MATDPLMERYTFDPHFEPEWCEVCGATGHCGINCPVEEDDDDDEDDGSPPDDSWIQSSAERAAGPPRYKTEYYDGGRLKRD